jgi:hypothetical protein
MQTVIQKLRFTGQNPILILNAPESFKDIMNELSTDIHTKAAGKYDYILAFFTSIKETEQIAKELTEMIADEGFLWVCYPKGTSKKYKSDLNRDKTVNVFAPYNFEAVTLVAIDDDWSAIRVKNVDLIKTMKRKTATSERGKERIKGNEGC